MRLTIRSKLITMIVVTVLLSIAGISTAVYYEINQMARNSFEESSLNELKQVDNFISGFMNAAQESAADLALNPMIPDAMGQLLNFTKRTDLKEMRVDLMTPISKNLFNFLSSMCKSHKAYDYAYIGLEDSGFVMSPEGSLPSGFNPVQRPWYKEAVSSPAETSISKAYQSVTGVPVSTIMAKIRNNGRVIGVAGIDINLSTLTSVVSNIKIGKSGYMMVMEGDGTILSSPGDKEVIFKKAAEVEDSGINTLGSMDDGIATVTINGVERLVRVYTSPELKWKLAFVINSSEVFSSLRNTLLQIFYIGIALLVVLGLIGLFFANSIARPIQSLVRAAGAVAKGDFEAIPSERKFSGELLDLQRSLKTMVGELVQFIRTSEEKSKEAEEQSKKAGKALEEAEQTRIAAETARKDGILQAAGQLELIVSNVTDSSQQLSAQISQSMSGSEMQRERTAEAATAMEQMNASVLEVAQNSGRAAESADKARSKAVEGGNIVDNVISSINEVNEATVNMSSGLENLGEQAEGIGKVMNVITDIADQTNLLALNAAIEAARAGEAGRGFAVVADEVRKLAEKTMEATKEVGQAVSAIQQGTRNSISDMSDASGIVTRSTEFAAQAGEALASIVEIVEDTADQVRAIATASEEQSAASEEISRNTEDVNRIASETAQAMNASSEAVAELAELSEHLQEVINHLKED